MKTALVLAGGGSRGAYQIGVWQALRELEHPIHIVTGTSVGALNGALILQDSFEDALSLWEALDTKSVFELSDSPSFSSYAKEFLKNGGAKATGLEKLIKTYINEEKIRHSGMEYGLVTVEKKNLKPHELFLESIPIGKLSDYLMASAACFPAVESYRIENKDFIDGGYYDNFPIQLALAKGAEKIIAVNLEAIGIVRDSVKKLQNTSDAIYLNPKWDLGNFLIFEKETIKRNIRLGYLDTLKAFSFFDGNAYTFSKNAFSELAKKKSATLKKWREFFRTFRLNGKLMPSMGYTLLEKAMQNESPKILTIPIILETAAEMAGRIFMLNPLTLYSTDSFHQALQKEVAPLLQEDVVKSFLKQKELRPSVEWFKKFNSRTITVLLACYFEENPGFLFTAATVFPKEAIAGFYLFVFRLL